MSRLSSRHVYCYPLIRIAAPFSVSQRVYHRSVSCYYRARVCLFHVVRGLESSSPVAERQRAWLMMPRFPHRASDQTQPPRRIYIPLITGFAAASYTRTHTHTEGITSTLDATMIAATRSWLRAHRKKLAIGAGVIGAGYVAGQYVLGKISEARQRMGEDRIAKEK